MVESKNDNVIRRPKNKEINVTKNKKSFYKKRKDNKYKKKFISASTESLQQLADYFNNNRH